MNADRKPTKFGWWLLEQMAARGMTQADFSRLVGLGQATTSRWIYDPTLTPNTTKLALLAEALDVPYGEVLHRAGHGIPEPPAASGIMRRLEAVLASVSTDDRRRIEALIEAIIAPHERPASKRRRSA